MAREGTVWRLEEKGRGSARKESLVIGDQIHFADHFDKKIVKIGQTVQKIWQGEGRLCVQFAMFLWKSLTKSK